MKDTKLTPAEIRRVVSTLLRPGEVLVANYATGSNDPFEFPDDCYPSGELTSLMYRVRIEDPEHVERFALHWPNVLAHTFGVELEEVLSLLSAPAQ